MTKLQTMDQWGLHFIHLRDNLEEFQNLTFQLANDQNPKQPFKFH